MAGELGLPQVIVPGGAEHIGILVSTPHVLPERWKKHSTSGTTRSCSPRGSTRASCGRSRARPRRRLQATRGNAVLMIPPLGTGRYAMPGGPLNDPTDDATFFAELKARVPTTHRDRRARGRTPKTRRSSRKPSTG